jgi:predicted nucleic acid-binding protein
VWTEELIEEWERVIVREGNRSADSAASVASAVRRFFARGRLDPESYLPLVEEALSRDPDDRAHIAACLSGGVDVLLTRNRRDFPIERLGDAGVRLGCSPL